MKNIEVNLKRQVLFAYENDKKVYEFDCVSGDEDHPTNIGTFTIFRKERKYRSKKYNVQMDYAMFFTNDGKAIHQGYAVGPLSYIKFVGIDAIGSHGCVRLAESDARTLFDWTPLHTKVIIIAG